MTGYAMLLLPALNRVYTGVAGRLTMAELAVLGDAALGGRIGGVAEAEIAGVPYVTFTADDLSDGDVAWLSTLSSAYALFERDGDALRPVALRPPDLFGSDLLTILKYPGKTNEQFTKLLLNVTALATDRPGDLLTGRLRVLDPLCGRGTTLNQAMMYGLSATGVDIDRKDFEAYGAFLKTWLRTARLKHTARAAPIRREHAVLGRRLDVELGADAERYRSGDVIRISMVNADTLHIGQLCKPRSFDAVVADLPYGVQHGSRNPGKKLVRGPLELLAAALPGWVRTLRPGGAVGLSWNTHLARREAVAEVLAGAGLTVLDSAAHRGFEHRVDQAILRDLMVARLPAQG